MKHIYRTWKCWLLVSGEQYIAALGGGVTILNRTTLEIVHHFSGFRYILGGVFISDDILAIFTGEQKIFFLQISEKKLLWACPRPRQLAHSGDIQCCHIPGTEKLACIARGKHSLREHFFLLIDCNYQTISIQEIPDCYRLVSALIYDAAFGLAFLCSEADNNGRGNMLYKIVGLEDRGAFSTICAWESLQSLGGYSGRFLFMKNYRTETPEMWLWKLDYSPGLHQLKCKEEVLLPFPVFRLERGPVGPKKKYLPKISWIDEKKGLLTTCNSNWIGLYDFFNKKIVIEAEKDEINCGMVLDGNLLIGSEKGLFVEGINLA